MITLFIYKLYTQLYIDFQSNIHYAKRFCTLCPLTFKTTFKNSFNLTTNKVKGDSVWN